MFRGGSDPRFWLKNAAKNHRGVTPAPRCLASHCDASYGAKAAAWGSFGATPRRLTSHRRRDPRAAPGPAWHVADVPGHAVDASRRCVRVRAPRGPCPKDDQTRQETDYGEERDKDGDPRAVDDARRCGLRAVWAPDRAKPGQGGHATHQARSPRSFRCQGRARMDERPVEIARAQRGRCPAGPRRAASCTDEKGKGLLKRQRRSPDAPVFGAYFTLPTS